MSSLAFYEFFAGGGMARAGLGPRWTCLFANDFDLKKASAYRANWGEGEFRLADIYTLDPATLPGRADLAWGSFPCQDLSLAGLGAGLAGQRSEAFWGFHRIVEALRAQKRAPRLLVLENVVGALTSNGGRDFAELCGALNLLGYRFGALTMDAVHFLPQSRPRLFIVAIRSDVGCEPALVSEAAVQPWASAALLKAQGQLRPDLRSKWLWWRMPRPAASNGNLAYLIDFEPAGVEWHDQAQTDRFLAAMSEPNREKVEQAKSSGRRRVGTIYRRTRLDMNGLKVQRAEVRFDDVAGCLRTPGGGSSRQFIMVVDGEKVRTRLLSTREAARLMGLPDDYKLPSNYNDAYHLVGDGLAVPVVRHLAQHLLEPLLVGMPHLMAAE